MSAPYLQVQQQRAPNAGGTFVIRFQALDELGAPIGLTRVTAASMALYNRADESPVFTARNILNVGNNSLDATGHVAVYLTGTDLATLPADVDPEFGYRRAVLTYTFLGPGGSPLVLPVIVDFPIRKAP